MLIIRALKGRIRRAEWDDVLGVLRGGGVVVFPTDTAYGLAVDPRVRGAAKKIYKIKGRDERKPLSVTVASTGMAKQYGRFTPLAARLASKHWPGALMLVVPLKKTAAAEPLKTLRGGDTVGLRYPDHPIAAALARKLGYPVTSTSANRSGQPVCYSIEEFQSQFSTGSLRMSLQGAERRSNPEKYGIATIRPRVGSRNDIKKLPDLFIDAGPLPRRPTSTVVDCTGRRPKILRQGRIRI